ncbi:MAG: hypothetical protein ACOCRK_09085 [bacterium]
MKFFKLVKLPYKEEKQPFMYYKDEEVEIGEFNSAFFMTKDLINFLGSNINQGRNFSII